MPNNDNRAFLAGVIGGGSLVRKRLPLRLIMNCRIDAAALNFLGKGVHAKREYVHQPAQKVDVRTRLRHARTRRKPNHRQ